MSLGIRKLVFRGTEIHLTPFFQTIQGSTTFTIQKRLLSIFYEISSDFFHSAEILTIRFLWMRPFLCIERILTKCAHNPLIKKREWILKRSPFFCVCLCIKNKSSVKSCRFQLSRSLRLGLCECDVSIEISRCVFRSQSHRHDWQARWEQISKWLHIIVAYAHPHIIYRMMNVRGHIHLQYKHLDNTFYLSRHHVKSMFRFLQPSKSLGLFMPFWPKRL